MFVVGKGLIVAGNKLQSMEKACLTLKIVKTLLSLMIVLKLVNKTVVFKEY